MSPIRPPPHAARLRRQPCARNLAIVAELPTNFSFRQKLSRSTAGPLRRIPEASAAPTRDSSVEMIERADAPATHGAGYPHSLTHDAAACPDERYIDGAAGHQFQIEGARFEPHDSQPGIGDAGAKYRAYRLLKHMLAD